MAPDRAPAEPDSEAAERYRQAAALRAVDWVESGMVVGLGTGSTALFAIRRIGALLAAGALRDVTGVPTSHATGALARRLGIPIVDDDIPGDVDLTIDGADEIDPGLDLIKGRGGAFLREKIVAQASRREIIVADESKLSPRLGLRAPVPVEILPFGWRSQNRYLESIGARPILRLGPDGTPARTDQGCWILDCWFGPIENPAGLADELSTRAGIVAHGLFLRLATDLVVAGSNGVIHRVRQ